MDIETWRTVDELLAEALDLPPAHRTDWLDALGPEHAALRPTLRRLLERAARVETGDFLKTLPPLESSQRNEAPSAWREGAVVGPYRLTRQIGSGGMGAVWLGERIDGLLDRPVAIKLPRFTAPDSELAARMARERTILASLTHPNIARIYDAGLDAAGQPYLALEYIEGIPITDYCARHGLDHRARVRLFLEVADAVAYAHAKLVVHRDLKPANILVSDDGKVSLLDFGIAKLLDQGLDPAGDLTRPANRLLTPDYASPEQIAGESISVASDVYSLGVLLYELLTGTTPYRLAGRSAAALERALAEVRLRRPSGAAADRSMARALRGDLDNIVGKALKIPLAERYRTVPELVDDLQRHRAGYPVSARPDSAGYRLRKFVGRHRIGVAAGAAVFVSVLAGAGTAVWQARIAIAERDRAEEIKTFITSIFRDANPYDAASQGDAVGALDLLLEAERRLDATAGMAADVRIELLTTLAAGLSSMQNLLEAETLARKTVAEATERLGPDHVLTLQARAMLLGVLFPSGRLPEMRAEVESVLAGVRRNPGAPPQLLLAALTGRIQLANSERDFETATALGAEALELARRELGDRNPQTLTTATLVATTHQLKGDKDRTLAAAERVYALTLAQGLEPGVPTARDARMLYGMALAEVRRYDEAFEHMSAAIEATVQVHGGDAQELGFLLNHLGRYEARAGRLREARTSYSESARIVGATVGEASPSHRAARSNLTGVLVAGRWTSAATPAADYLLRLAAEHPPPVVEAAYTVAAAAAAYDGDLERARAYLERSGAAVADPRRAGGYLDKLYVRGLVARLAGEREAALTHLEASLDAVAAAPDDGAEDMHLLTEIGLSQLDLGRWADAERSLRGALERYRALQPYPTPRRADALLGLGRVLMTTSRPREARPLLEEADSFWRDFDPSNPAAVEAARWIERCHAALGIEVPAAGG